MVHADINVEVSITIVIRHSKSPDFPLIRDGNAAFLCGLRQCPILMNVELHGPETPPNEQIKVIITIGIEPDYALRGAFPGQYMRFFESTFSELSIDHHRSRAVGEGEVLQSVQIEIRGAHSRSKPTGLGRSRYQIFLRHIIPLGVADRAH